MQYLDFVAFRDIGPVLTLNIGGIANCQSPTPTAADYGLRHRPGQRDARPRLRALLNRPYDHDGEVAARGRSTRPCSTS